MIWRWLLMAVVLPSTSSSFRILDTVRADVFVSKGFRSTLQCKTSSAFNKCIWARPNSSVICATFANLQSKECETLLKSGDDNSEIQVSPWTVRVEADNTLCALDIDEVDEIDAGSWACSLESPAADGKYRSDTDVIQLHLVQPPELSIEEPVILNLIDGQDKVFTCRISGGRPDPAVLKWSLNDLVLQEKDILQNGQELKVKITPEWNGKILKCSTTQMDTFGNREYTKDERKVNVASAKTRTKNLQGTTTKRGQFILKDTYPSSGSILMAPSVKVTLSCTTTSPWLDCKWKHPNFNEPCSIFSDTKSRSCRQWFNQGSSTWTVIAESPTNCTILGDRINPSEAGQWNCELGSFPLLGSNNEYSHLQNYFQLTLLTKALVNDNQLPEESLLTEGEQTYFEIDVSNPEDVYPPPQFRWYLDNNPIQLEQTSKFGISPTHQVSYKASLSDSGKRLSCRVIQKDDEGNEVSTQLSTLLKITAQPKPKPMNVGVLASLISAAIFLVLIAILILFLWKTQKMCFKGSNQNTTVYVTPSPPRQGSAEVQTTNLQSESVGVGADFGPSKPKRSGSRDELNQPLLGSSHDAPDSAIKLDHLLPEDELNAWDDEGPTMSLATSLSSINTSVEEKEWETTLRSYGPKFSAIADMVAGLSDNDDQESDSTSTNIVDGSEV